MLFGEGAKSLTFLETFGQATTNLEFVDFKIFGYTILVVNI